MIMPLVRLLVLTAAFTALVLDSASAKSKLDRDAADRIAEDSVGGVKPKNLPPASYLRVGTVRAEDRTGFTGLRGPIPLSFGYVGDPAASSPGLTVKRTWEDWQYSVKGRNSDYSRTVPAIHFGYTDLQWSDIAYRGFGYNVYDPVGGNWPRGLEVGCRVQTVDCEGRWPALAVIPDGRVVLAGIDNSSGVVGELENHMYGNTSLYGCFWAGGAIIPREQYSVGFVDESDYLHHVLVDVVLDGSDTVYHVLAHSSGFDALEPGYDVTGPVIQYFRKVNGRIGMGTWTGPITIDTGGYYGVIATSSADNHKVAVAYVAHTDWGMTHNNADFDIKYRESFDAGLTWNPVVNITNYDRNIRSHNPWLEVQPMYDSEGWLHVLWNARPLPEHVYDSLDFFWDDFSCSLFHWSNRTGSISRVANREYGVEWNTRVCGFGGANALYLANFNIAECNGRLYITYSGWNDVFGTGQIDDCASSFFDAPSRAWQANGEIYLHVSNDLDGLFWDAPRNITNSHTPGCDSAGFGGIFANETQVMISEQGFDSASYGVELTFPASERVVVDPTYNGSHYLNLFYLQDLVPGNAAIGFGTVLSDNPLRWMRIGCVDPISSPQIDFSPKGIGYPTFFHHGQTLSTTVTVINDGNITLNVTKIGVREEWPIGWLTISESALWVPAGMDNTSTFEIRYNENYSINVPGTVIALNGEVYLLSNAPPPYDSVSFFITNLLVADTVGYLLFDTVATTATMLVVDNHGTLGNGGSYNHGRANLDYTVLGADCDSTASIYLFDGGPFVIQRQSGDNYRISHGMHQSGGFLDMNAFTPLVGSGWRTPGPFSGPSYDGFFSGSFVNWDTTIACEMTVYAPTGGGDSTNFVIMKYAFYAADGNPHYSLVFGSAQDWDVPSHEPAKNRSEVSPDCRVVYFQGLDQWDSVGCQENQTRFAAEGFLGWYTDTDHIMDPCVNRLKYYGQYAARNDSDRVLVDDTDYAEFLWNRTYWMPGLNPAQAETDLHGVTTFVHDVSLGATDTLTFYTTLLTVHNGTAADVDAAWMAARAWYDDNLRNSCCSCGCCICLTGNVDGDDNEIVDIGDLTALIEYLFIWMHPLYTPPECLDEANVDGTGIVDIGDITRLINYLFISFEPPVSCFDLQ